jgi:hypothetical protein
MPWQGHTDNMIDRCVKKTPCFIRSKSNYFFLRFDVRAILDYIPPYNPKLAPPLSAEDQELEAELNYNRYKEIVEITRTGGIFHYCEHFN